MKKKEIVILVFILLLAFFLRVYKLAQVPPSLFGDEVDTGYQAYSILKTGRDYFGRKLPIHFQSYGDWRVPFYIYLLVPFIFLLGLSEFVIRLPAAIFGTLGVFFTFLLAKRITKNEKIALTSAFLLSISPWHLQFSRGAFEAILITVFYPLGIIFFLKGIKKDISSRWLILSALIFGLTPYTYNTPKLFLPLILLVLMIIYRQELLVQKKRLLLFILTCFLALMPLVVDTFSGPGVARFSSVSIFNDKTTPERVRLARQACPYDGVLERALHNKVTFWIEDFVSHYLQAFSPEFLFISGDPNPRHSIGRGELYLFELPFLLIGLGLVFSQLINGNQSSSLILSWLVLTPLPAALTQDGGNHAIRLLHFLPWLQILTAMGMVRFYRLIRKKIFKFLFFLFLSLIVVLSLFLYLHDYYLHYPRIAGRWWNYGYRQAFEYVNQVKDQYDDIYISSSWEPSMVYTLLYTRYDPTICQEEISISPERIGKYHFLSPDINALKRGEGKARTLYVLNPGELESLGFKIEEISNLKKIKSITGLDENDVFVIFSSTD